jgi:hypothetical protein
MPTASRPNAICIHRYKMIWSLAGPSMAMAQFLLVGRIPTSIAAGEYFRSAAPVSQDFSGGSRG